uniref:DUF834 domain-containing protein n=1 Tax=Oryza meridionalis TaxID=40149 RepID=A0A0E0EH50_9ORYZ
MTVAARPRSWLVRATTKAEASDGDNVTAEAGVDDGHSCGERGDDDCCGRDGREPRLRMQAMATATAGVDEGHNCGGRGDDDGCGHGGREPRPRMQAMVAARRRRRRPQGDEDAGGTRAVGRRRCRRTQVRGQRRRTQADNSGGADGRR